MTGALVPAVRLDGEPDESAYLFGFRGRDLLVAGDGPAARVPSLGELRRSAAPAGLRRFFLGTIDGRQVFAAELPERTEAPEGMAFHGLRALFSRLDDALFAVAGRAVQIVDWDRDHRYCGRCATATEDHPTERSKQCPACGLAAYPRLAPAVIVLVTRGDEVLLARSPKFPPGMYSTLAGFVEPGETLEEAVVREIEEEVGVTVCNIRYFASQPWPFPNSLMIGFTARHRSGEIAIHEEEIESAGWFAAETLPRIPPKISIARALIDSFVRGTRG